MVALFRCLFGANKADARSSIFLFQTTVDLQHSHVYYIYARIRLWNCFRSWHFYWNLICTWLQCVDQTLDARTLNISSLLTALAVLSLPIHIRIGSISVSAHTEAKRCVNLINDFGDHYELRPKTKIIFLLVLKHWMAHNLPIEYVSWARSLDIGNSQQVINVQHFVSLRQMSARKLCRSFLEPICDKPITFARCSQVYH